MSPAPARARQPQAADVGPLLRLDRVTKVYPGVVANDAVTIDLLPGEIHAVVGENGAGKTTLLSVMYGLQRPDAGTIAVRGADTTLDSPRQALGLGIGYVQQHFSLIPTLTVGENLALALRASGERVSVRSGAARVRELSRRFGIDVPADVPVQDLSVGEQQRAELLKSLARRAEIFLLDEPNALLTPQEWDQLAGVLRRLTDSGVGIFLVSHKLEEVLRVADRVSVLRRGRLVATKQAAEASRRQLAELMIGTLAAEETAVAVRDRAAHDVRLEVTDLRVRGDRGEAAVHGVSFRVHAGEILGIAGVEGGGQIELTEAIAGIRPVESGNVQIDGRDVDGLSVQQRQRLGVGHVPADRQAAGLVATLSVTENLGLPAVHDAATQRFGFLRRRSLRSRAEALIRRFDIRVVDPDAPAGTLSGGNQQRVLLARELAREPKVLLCCYATRGLDFAGAEAVQQAVLAQRDAGAAILYASIELDELLALTDRVIVLHHGRLAGELRTVDASAEQLGLLMGGAAA